MTRLGSMTVRARGDPAVWVTYGLAAAFLGLFVVYPLVRVAATPGWAQWHDLLTNPRWRAVLGNTALMVLLSTTTATALGFAFAYGVLRAQIPGAGLFRLVALAPLVTPPFVGGLSFIFLFGRQGLITYRLLGQEVNIYGWPGVWLAQTMAFFPVAYLAIGTVLRRISPTLEQAARALGAGPWHVFRTVVVPLAAPGIGAGALLVAIHVLADFGNPALIGGRFRVLATEAYAQVAGWADYRMAAVLGIVLFLPTLALFLVQRRLERVPVVTVVGRGATLPGVRPAGWVRAGLCGICGLTSLLMVAKYAVIFLGAFSRVWGYDHALTVHNFAYVVLATREFGNSVRFAAAAAGGAAVLATVLAYLVHRRALPLARVLDAVTLLPAAVPGTLLGVAYVLAFNAPPLALAGGGAIIVLSMIVRFLPVGYRSAVAALRQIDRSIEESAADLGATGLRVFWDIVLPLIRAAFSAALVYVFVRSINTLSAVVFLVSHGTGVASASILNFAEQGYWGQAAAMASSLIVLALAALGAFRLLLGGRVRLFEL